MKVRTPNFMICECKRLIEALPAEQKQKAERVCEKLHQMNSLEDIVRMMEYMAELEKIYVNPRMEPELFKRSYVSSGLIKALQEYKNHEEAKEMLAILEDMSKFKSSWCQEDEIYKMDRTFRLVKTRKDWMRVCARAQVLPNRGTIKIALEVKTPKKTKTADKAWQKACKNLSTYTFAELDYEIWFRQVERACYYIYLP